MKIRLKKSLPDHPAGTVFETGDIGTMAIDRFNTVTATNKGWVVPYIDEIVRKYEDYPDWFERIDETPLYWEPENGQCYYYIDIYGAVRVAIWKSELAIAFIGNTFSTHKAAQAHVEYLKALTRVRKWIAENNIELGEHKCSTPRQVEIGCDYRYKIVATETSEKLNPILPTFKDYDNAKKVVASCYQDLLVIFGGES